MKRSIMYLIAICLLPGVIANAQLSRITSKIKKSVSNQVLGTSDQPTGTQKQQPEPSCACDEPTLIFSLGGGLNLMYSEISIDVLNDGSILVMDRVSNKYYIAKDGVTKGPYTDSDPQIAPFLNKGSSDSKTMADLNKEYISKSGEKYLITFGGKTYGPYAQINGFAVTKSREKFAAVVVENLLNSEADAKKMEQAMKNAKTDQERMDLSMKYAQQMQKQMMAGGGPESIQPKLVSNIQGTSYSPATGGTFDAEMKYDDILCKRYDGIVDLKGNKVIAIKPEHAGSKQIFVSTDNSKYAAYDYGTLTFSDGTKMTDMFNLHLIKVNGQVYIAYMYYSPKANSVMQCKIPF